VFFGLSFFFFFFLFFFFFGHEPPPIQTAFSPLEPAHPSFLFPVHLSYHQTFQAFGPPAVGSLFPFFFLFLFVETIQDPRMSLPVPYNSRMSTQKPKKKTSVLPNFPLHCFLPSLLFSKTVRRLPCFPPDPPPGCVIKRFVSGKLTIDVPLGPPLPIPRTSNLR